MNFRESSKGGGGVIFDPKIYVADFGNFKQGFLSMKLIQKSNFRVQGMFLQQLYWEKSKQVIPFPFQFHFIIALKIFRYQQNPAPSLHWRVEDWRLRWVLMVPSRSAGLTNLVIAKLSTSVNWRIYILHFISWSHLAIPCKVFGHLPWYTSNTSGSTQNPLEKNTFSKSPINMPQFADSQHAPI